MKLNLLVGIFFFAQTTLSFSQITLSGQVSDAQGLALPDATVMLSDLHVGATTDRAGDFSFKNIKPGKHVLSIQYIGFKSITDTLVISQSITVEYEMVLNPLLSDEFVVETLRAKSKTPVTFQNLDKPAIEANNLGQDMPILLNQTVSAVTTSDAGGGVGYTGIRIRGTNGTGINVTVNGVPINDAESHSVYWVNMPDLASSASSIQIQRGVGTSTYGAGAFGASINIETAPFDSSSYVEINNSIGYFNTRKHNLMYSSGLLANNFAFEGRLSEIRSDGYVDRSAANLRSWFLSGGYFGKKYMLKAVSFSGRELTQQAWYGTPESRITGDEEKMLEHAANNGYSEAQTLNLLNSGRTYNFYTYNNEIDDYRQDNYQLIQGLQLNRSLYINVTGHYTRGQGFFEQKKEQSDLTEFGLTYPIIGGDTIINSDVVLRRWLDNHFFGGVYAIQYSTESLKITAGGAANQYLGEHFGELIWLEYAQGTQIAQRYYESDSRKTDISNYLKAEYVFHGINFFVDLQYRQVHYRSSGIDNDQRSVNINREYSFFNPKAGLSYRINSKQNIYASFGQSHREPVRSDFTDAVSGTVPKPEQLTNIEAGWSIGASKWTLGVNGFWMGYKNQLVLTGEVNDVGSPIRVNVPSSFRQGVEAVAVVQLSRALAWNANAALSQNKIVQFDEIVYDYTTGYDRQLISHRNADIAFSPAAVIGSQWSYATKFGLTCALISKFVSQQFLDNTSNANRSLPSYFVNDIRLTYAPRQKQLKRAELTLLVNNVLNELYSSNGYTYSYIYGSLVTENFYYPQAGTNWLLGLKIRF